jgi:LPXTG-site transpeptidase (sortase) family protein
MSTETTRTLGPFSRAIVNVSKNLWLFLGVFVLFFFMEFSTLASLDLLPEAKKAVAVEKAGAAVIVASKVIREEVPVADPDRIVIEKVGVDVAIKNPSSTEIKVLDDALLGGAVRYPTSASLGEEGNVVIFGHSSYLPVVSNENFKAFNEIQKLERGDEIVVYGGGYAHTYMVDSVEKMKANEGTIPLDVTGHKLTLATCNSFGTPQDRFVVSATLVKSTQSTN